MFLYCMSVLRAKGEEEIDIRVGNERLQKSHVTFRFLFLVCMGVFFPSKTTSSSLKSTTRGKDEQHQQLTNEFMRYIDLGV